MQIQKLIREWEFPSENDSDNFQVINNSKNGEVNRLRRFYFQ